MKIHGLNIVIATTTGIVIGFNNIEYAKSTNPPFLIKSRKTNIIPNGIPKIVTVLVTVAVSIYVVWKTKKLDNSIYPTNQVTSEPRSNEAQVDTQRLDNQPDMFYRMELSNRELSEEAGKSQQNATTEEEQTGECLNKKELLLTLRTTKTMNIITLLLVLGFLPRVILGMVHHNYNVATGEFENFTFFVNKSRPMILLCLAVLYMVVLKRINKAEQ